MKITLSFLLIFISAFVSGQLLISKSEFDLGNIEHRNDDVVDFQIYNSLKDTLFLLKTESSGNASFKYTNKIIKPGYVSTLRIKINPNQKGKIVEKAQLFFSNSSKPVTITIRAKVKKLEKNNLQDCPSFTNYRVAVNENGVYSPLGEISNYRVILSEKNKQTKEVAEVIQNEKEDLEQDDSREIPTSRPPRKPKENKTYDNRRDKPSLGQILFGKNEIIDTTSINLKESPQLIDEPKELKSVQESDPNLLDDSYKPNNVVFLIDASTSMREHDKMDLLKKSMIELLKPLRQVDYLSIVTYSGNAEIILPPTAAIKKGDIIKIIENIKADGSTQASKGIKKAIQVAKSNFLTNGNNQILLASDGAFDIGERNKSLRKKISIESQKGLTISVLGIKNERWTNKSLKEICELGKGDLIRINKESDTRKVLEEVKKNSLNK